MTDTILLTGFEPFGGEIINPAWEVTRLLDGYVCGEYTVVSRQLPCTFSSSSEVLYQLIKEHQPKVVLCLGQAGGLADIAIEKVALNWIDAKIADNLGDQPIDRSIVVDAPLAYFANLDSKSILSALRLANIPCHISYSAGSYVCNYVFYSLMHYIHNHASSNLKGGFIHIPYLPEQTLDNNQPSMLLTEMIAGLKVVLNAVAADV